MVKMKARLTIIAVLLAPAIVSHGSATSLQQTQLRGVSSAAVVSFVSQYLPAETQALQGGIKDKSEEMLRAAGIKTESVGDRYLSIDISGNKLDSSLCTDAYLLEVTVTFSEPARLVRDPHLRIPGGNLVTWSEKYSDVVRTADLSERAQRVAIDAVELFLGNVESMNRSDAKKP
jgi:hypothetical protein